VPRPWWRLVAVLDAAQLSPAPARRRKNVALAVRKLAEIEIPALDPGPRRRIARTYCNRPAPVEARRCSWPPSSAGQRKPQAWPTCWPIQHGARGDKRDSEMRTRRRALLRLHPVMIVALASVVGARYLAIGTGDTELYIFADAGGGGDLGAGVPVPGRESELRRQGFDS